MWVLELKQMLVRTHKNIHKMPDKLPFEVYRSNWHAYSGKARTPAPYFMVVLAGPSTYRLNLSCHAYRKLKSASRRERTFSMCSRALFSIKLPSPLSKGLDDFIVFNNCWLKTNLVFFAYKVHTQKPSHSLKNWSNCLLQRFVGSIFYVKTHEI